MVVAVASPSSAPPSAGRAHPTYKEMIVQALTELREPGGSTRRAIASYIADHFSGLHSRHDALLSVHLRRLRSQGQLRLVSGHAYLLSTDAPPQQRRGRGRPPKHKGRRGPGRPRKSADLAAPVPALQGPKRGPGRPRKNALVPVASSSPPLPLAVAPPAPSGVKRGRGRPRKNALVPVASSTSTLPLAIAPPPLKRGRGRPRKNSLVLVPSSSPTLPRAIAQLPASGVKRGRGRPRKNPNPVATSVSLLPAATAPTGVLLGSSMNTSLSSKIVAGARQGLGHPPQVAVAGKRKRGRPPKKNLQASLQSVDASLTKRRPGRPRKEMTLSARNYGQMPEAPLVAMLAEAADQAGAVQNEEARSLQPDGSPTSLTRKRGRGRPRKRPLESETAKTGVVASVEKRGRGRPRKENPSAASSEEAWDPASTATKRGRGRPRKEKPAETRDDGSVTIKRGRGRPRKDSSFVTVSAETALEVSPNVTEGKPEGGDDAMESGKKAETQTVLLVDGMDAEPANAGGVLESGEEAAIAPVDAGGVLMSEEKAGNAPMDAGAGLDSGEKPVIAPMDTGSAMPAADTTGSNLGTTSN